MNGWSEWKADLITKLFEKEIYDSIEETCHVVLSASKNQVPLKDSFLLKSGIVKIINQNNKVIGIISYGGGPGTGRPDVPYAIRWHETQANFQHGRKWHYLSDPLRQLGPRTLESFLREKMRRILS